MAMRYFYDVPVYRLTEEEYLAAQDAFVDRCLAQYQLSKDDNHVHWLRTRYGGGWQYNEIIGFIRLHFLGSQIRGEYFKIRGKRVVKSRTKTFYFNHWKLVPEIEIPPDATSEKIFSLILRYLEDCRRELKRRYIDFELLKSIGPYVNWKRLYEEGGKLCT